MQARALTQIHLFASPHVDLVREMLFPFRIGPCLLGTAVEQEFELVGKLAQQKRKQRKMGATKFREANINEG